MTDWFTEARYGMFVHWGPYSVAGRGEWVMNRERIPHDEYRDRYARAFTAERYAPDVWARLAVEAGMKYIVLTTRHHDGFALWDTATTGFNATKIGPKRDLLTPYVAAARRAGLRVGFYYSFADWSHPDYPDAYARDWPTGWRDEASRVRFIEYVRAQLRELLTSYGTIDILWYDGCIPAPLDGEATNALVRSLQPEILINSRMGPGDFANSEQAIVPPKENIPWEACMTLNANWGYHAGDQQWKSARQVIGMLTESVKGGGNLLLNVGPTGDGTIPAESVRILREAGAWLAQHREFLSGSVRSPFSWSTSATVTTGPHVVYLHFFNHPGDEFCYVEIANRVLSVRDIGTGERLAFEQTADGRLILRGLRPPADGIATTIAVDVEGTPAPQVAQKTFWIPGV